MSWKNKINGKPIALVVIIIAMMTICGCCYKSSNSGNSYPLMSGDLLFQVNKSSELVDAITNSTISFEDLSYSNVTAYEGGQIVGVRHAWKALASLNVLGLNFGLTVHL